MAYMYTVQWVLEEIAISMNPGKSGKASQVDAVFELTLKEEYELLRLRRVVLIVAEEQYIKSLAA